METGVECSDLDINTEFLKLEEDKDYKLLVTEYAKTMQRI
jgi:hypothetical protein